MGGLCSAHADIAGLSGSRRTGNPRETRRYGFRLSARRVFLPASARKPGTVEISDFARVAGTFFNMTVILAHSDLISTSILSHSETFSRNNLTSLMFE